MPDYPKAQRSQRVDLEDWDFAIADAPQARSRQPGSDFFTNPAGDRMWIIGGFNLTFAGADLTVTRGVAILGQREKGQVVNGVLTSEGDASKTQDLSTFGNATYGVFVRFELVDGAFQNRLFWDDVGAQEFSQLVPTRRVANWGMRVQLTSPGAEWFQIERSRNRGRRPSSPPSAIARWLCLPKTRRRPPTT